MGIYKGGDVDFNDKQYAVKTDENGREYLSYIGSETDLRNTGIPVVPDGDYYMMFANTNIEYGPKMPGNERDGSYMFFNCPNLREPVQFGPETKLMTGTYDSCVNMEMPAQIPEGVTNIDNLHANCPNLGGGIYVPDSVVSAESAFQNSGIDCVEGCRNVRNARAMVADCPNFTMPPVDMNYAECDCEGIFEGCHAYEAILAGQADVDHAAEWNKVKEAMSIDRDALDHEAAHLIDGLAPSENTVVLEDTNETETPAASDEGIGF